MRRLMMATAIAAAAGAGSLIASSAQALPGAGGLRSADGASVEQVRVVCPRPYWNGWRWVQPPCTRVLAPVVPYALVAPPPPPPVVVVRPYRRHYYY